MSSQDNGGPAFPRQFQHWDNDNGEWRPSEPEEGMTLRDYFAAKAMQMLMTKYEPLPGNPIPPTVQGAYQYADAMLKERQA